MGAAFLCFEVPVPQGSWKVKSFPAVEAFGLSKQRKNNRRHPNKQKLPLASPLHTPPLKSKTF